MNRFGIFLWSWVFVFAASASEAPDSGSTPSCDALYRTKDFPRAAKVCAADAEKGNPQAQFLMGRMHEEGDGVAQDDAIAVKWYRLAADKGHATSQRRLA